MSIAKTPEPPYYAVIFTATTSANLEGYEELAGKMVELASAQEGFLGIEWAGGDAEITVSYWKDAESIRKWHANAEHQVAQKKGYETWYQTFGIRIAKIERDYFFERK